MNSKPFKDIYVMFIVVFLSVYPSVSHSENTARTSSDNLPLQVTQLARLDGIPWGVDFLNDQTLLITLKSGRLATLETKTLAFKWIEGVPSVIDAGQGGLMDVAVLHSQTQPGWIYLSYTKPVSNGTATALGRGQLHNGKLINWQTLFTASHPSRSSKHFGARIAFDHQGHVFLSLGERGNRKDAQNLQRDAGKIIRLNIDGTIPGLRGQTPQTRRDRWIVGTHRLSIKATIMAIMGTGTSDTQKRG